MRLSQYFIPTLKETPADAELPSHQLMLRAGMIRRLASGLYTWLPLGLRVQKKVVQVVREEMERAGAIELLMPAVQPAELWRESGRWEQYGSELLKLTDRNEREFCFGPTHEEVITDIMRSELRSYKQLPLTVFQIQTKFRDEIRPRYGVMRGREFLMKDAYSFHLDSASLQKTYDRMFEAYHTIFKRLGLKIRSVQADPGSIGGEITHEFHVLANSGEDELLYSDSSDFAANVEVCHAKAGDPSPDGKGILKSCRGIEVGHIFQLGDKYSKTMGATVLDEKGQANNLQMGCYGMGISRIVAAAIEQHHDDKGIIWPSALAPFDVIIIPINAHKSHRVKEACDQLYASLNEKEIAVLYDDRPERPGVLFANADLIGIPHRIVISERGLDQGDIEYKHRTDQETQHIKLTDTVDYLTNLMSTD